MPALIQSIQSINLYIITITLQMSLKFQNKKTLR